MPMLRTIKITVTAVSTVNPCAVPRSKSAAPCTVKQHVHPATSCSYGGGILLQLRSDWVVNIAQSRKHHTRAEHAVLLCAYGARARFHQPILRSALSAVSSAASAPRVVLFQRTQDN